jgi:hypothetical protein
MSPTPPPLAASCRAAEHALSDRRHFAGRADPPCRHPRRPPSFAARQPATVPDTLALGAQRPGFSGGAPTARRPLQADVRGSRFRFHR